MGGNNEVLQQYKRDGYAIFRNVLDPGFGPRGGRALRLAAGEEPGFKTGAVPSSAGGGRPVLGASR